MAFYRLFQAVALLLFFLAIYFFMEFWDERLKFQEVGLLKGHQITKLQLQCPANEAINQFFKYRPQIRKRSKRAMVRNNRKVWNIFYSGAKYVLPYKIMSKEYTANDRSEIEGAMKEIEKHSCILFQEMKTRAEEDYYRRSYFHIENKSKKGCRTNVGRNFKGGRHILYLEKEIKDEPLKLKKKKTVDEERPRIKTCINRGLITHELFHLLGFYHEHSGPYRDKKVKINSKNVSKEMKSNFKKIPHARTFGIMYDYLSLMHYRKDAFASKSNLVTIEPLLPEYLDKIGKATEPSELDWFKLNVLYDCPGVEAQILEYNSKNQMNVVRNELKKHPNARQIYREPTNNLKKKKAKKPSLKFESDNRWEQKKGGRRGKKKRKLKKSNKNT